MNTDDTTWHVWWTLPYSSPNNRRVVDKYSTRDEAYREHKAAIKEGLHSYLTKQDPSNDNET